MIFLDILVLEENHPVLPKRVSNVYDLAKLINFKKKINFIENQKANIKTLRLFHHV